MPWKECDAVSERMMFVSRLLNEEKMSDLCREFGISRKTGYKIFERYKYEGIDGLKDQCRAPRNRPNETPVPIQKLILELREEHPSWGAPKIKAYLENKNPNINFPVTSTIHALLEKHNLVKRKKKRSDYKAEGTDFKAVDAPNQLWCTDFKGQFRMQNRQYCYPLTITDQYSRFLLSCESMESINEKECIKVFGEVFEQYGLPDTIRSDNGVPFATRSFFGLSKLSIFWLKHQIKLERIKPGCPQQNGRHERMHRTLKNETTKPAALNIFRQQDKFDAFKEVFNNERPHQAIEMKTPASVYSASSRKYVPVVDPLEYPFMDLTLRVDKGGRLHLPNQKKLYIGEVFIGENMGIKAIEEDIWKVNFMDYELGFFNLEDPKLEIVTNPFLLKSMNLDNEVLPMCPE